MAEPNPDSSRVLRRQLEIYKLGLAGKTLDPPVSVDEIRLQGQEGLDLTPHDYLAWITLSLRPPDASVDVTDAQCSACPAVVAGE